MIVNLALKRKCGIPCGAGRNVSRQRLYFSKKSDGVIASTFEFEKSSVFRVMI